MDKMLKEIISLMESQGMECTPENAQTILNNILNKNTFQKLVLNTVKKEYDIR